jgi:DNA polymerase zeta
MELVKDLGRTTMQSTGRNEGKLDRWNYTTTSSIRLTGRHTLPIWRVLKADVNLTQYTFENIAFHVLRERYGTIPLPPWLR